MSPVAKALRCGSLCVLPPPSPSDRVGFSLRGSGGSRNDDPGPRRVPAASAAVSSGLGLHNHTGCPWVLLPVERLSARLPQGPRQGHHFQSSWGRQVSK